MKEYDLFIPLNYNDGTSIESDKLQDISRRLLDEFGGLTFFSQPNQGFWRMGDVTFRDNVVIFRVFATRKRRARQFLSKLKQELLVTMRQEAILSIERNVGTV